MPLSNQEKQERFRRKEELAQKAKDLFIQWQVTRGFDFSQSPSEVNSQLTKIVELPSKWTDEDYQAALFKLNLFERNLLSNNPHLLENDIWAGRQQDNSVESVRNGKEAIANARTHVHLINSTFGLSPKRTSDNAAVIMEVARNLGLTLLSEATKGYIPRSNATTVCLLLSSPYLPKPKWLLKAIADFLKEQIPTPEFRKELAAMLTADSEK
ncbi:MAG: hypothetical protein MJ202_03215 [Lentisphaeria bacterium]|nr:hypothetical protein [Lentisphaeria bacterium]